MSPPTSDEPSTPTMNELLRRARGRDYTEPEPQPTADEMNAALRAGWSRPAASDPARAIAPTSTGPDYGGGARGVPLPETPGMDDLLKTVIRRRRPDAFSALGRALHLHLDEEEG